MIARASAVLARGGACASSGFQKGLGVYNAQLPGFSSMILIAAGSHCVEP